MEQGKGQKGSEGETHEGKRPTPQRSHRGELADAFRAYVERIEVVHVKRRGVRAPPSLA